LLKNVLLFIIIINKYLKFNSSIRGQQNINEIHSLNTESLEKVDLSNSGMASANFPLWLYDANKLREIDISNTQMVGLPQREFAPNINGCNFSNTPICGSYENSPYKDFIPEVCVKSCTNGATYIDNSSNNNNNSNSGKTSSGGSTKIWPYILIGVGVLLVLALLAFLLMKKKGKKGNTYEEYEANKPAPIKAKKENIVEEEEEPLEITVHKEDPTVVSKPQISPFVASGPPTPASDLENMRIEEEALNNYNNAYGGDARKDVYNENRNSKASAKEIYKHNGNTSFDQDNLQTHPSIYNTMTTDNDSDDDEQDSNIINQPIINAINDNQEKTPTLLRRQSSKKQKNVLEEQEYEPTEIPQEQYELYIANWDYAPTLSDELALVAGDVIEIKKKFDDGWCDGYNRRTNQTGIVPLCYLKQYED